MIRAVCIIERGAIHITCGTRPRNNYATHSGRNRVPIRAANGEANKRMVSPYALVCGIDIHTKVDSVFPLLAA